MGSGLNIAGATCNVITLLFLLVATIGSWWTWGSVNAAGLFVDFSFGPWVASQYYEDLLPHPCLCLDEAECAGDQAEACFGLGNRVFWTDLKAATACRPGSQFFENFAGPLDYCTFPKGFDPANHTATFPIGKNKAYYGSAAPEGTEFKQPTQAPVTQGLIVTATILAFLAVVAGFAQVASVAAFLSLVTFVLTIAAFAIWSGFEYSHQILDSNPEVGVPLWTADRRAFVALPTDSANSFAALGGSYGVAVAAFATAFFATLLHVAALGSSKSEPKPKAQPAAAVPPPTAQPAQPAPAAAVEQPAAAPVTQEVTKV